MSRRLLTNDAVSPGAEARWHPRGLSIRWTVWDAVRAAMQRHRSRAYISELDARALKDIGITFAEAEAEANRPFWRS